MIYPEFCEKLKTASAGSALDMYDYGCSCGLLQSINLTGIRLAFEGDRLTKKEADLYVKKIFSGYCKGTKLYYPDKIESCVFGLQRLPILRIAAKRLFFSYLQLLTE